MTAVDAKNTVSVVYIMVSMTHFSKLSLAC